MSDIEETLSVLSRNSRSTTPASRTPTPSLGQFGNFSMSDLGWRNSSDTDKVSDKHIIPIVTVFDDLKDYLSDSDLSLEYQIARQRRRHKNTRNLNKQAQLSNILTHKNKLMGQKEHAEMREQDSITSVPEAGGGARRNLTSVDDKNNPSKSASRLDISRNVFESEETSILSGKKSAEFVKNDKSTINTQRSANDKELASHKDPLWKNKQENDFAVRKINNGSPENQDASSPTSGQSLESIMDEKKSIRDKTNVFSRNNCGGQYNTLGSPRSLGRGSSHKLQQEKENSCNNFYQTHSLPRRKLIKPASSSSLGSLIESFEPKSHKTSCQDKVIKDPLFAGSQLISNDATSNGFNGFATSFSNVVNCGKIQPKFAEKKSVEDCAKNLNNQPRITERPKNGNISEIDIIRQYMGFDDKSNKKETCHRSGTNGSVKNLHDFRFEILSICIFFQFSFVLKSCLIYFLSANTHHFSSPQKLPR